MRATGKERQQLKELWARCAEADDFETLKYYIYSYDPERYLHLFTDTEAIFPLWEMFDVFKPLFTEENNQQQLNQGGYQ